MDASRWRVVGVFYLFFSSSFRHAPSQKTGVKKTYTMRQNENASWWATAGAQRTHQKAKKTKTTLSSSSSNSRSSMEALESSAPAACPHARYGRGGSPHGRAPHERHTPPLRVWPAGTRRVTPMGGADDPWSAGTPPHTPPPPPPRFETTSMARTAHERQNGNRWRGRCHSLDAAFDRTMVVR